jgi:hypothetical protein
MTGIKHKAVVLSMSAALILTGPLGAYAIPAAGSAAQCVAKAGETVGNGVVLTGKRFRGRGNWRGHRGGFRHRRYRGHDGLWLAPLLAAPFLYGSGYYGYDGYDGYDDGDDYCYRECRYDHGPSYCRRYWYRYC